MRLELRANPDFFDRELLERTLPVTISEDGYVDVEVVEGAGLVTGEDTVALGWAIPPVKVLLFRDAIEEVFRDWDLERAMTAVLVHELCHFYAPVLGDVHGLPHRGPCILSEEASEGSGEYWLCENCETLISYKWDRLCRENRLIEEEAREYWSRV